MVTFSLSSMKNKALITDNILLRFRVVNLLLVAFVFARFGQVTQLDRGIIWDWESSWKLGGSQWGDSFYG